MADLIKRQLTGQTILEVRSMTRAEIEEEAWDADNHARPPIVLVLSSGAKLYAMRDEEGNGAGTLVLRDPENAWYVDPEPPQR